jgi:hypothetical protein
MESMASFNRVELFKNRFKRELGYSSVEAWPIFVNNSRSKIMYSMIHATDHPAGPILMQRAYRKAVGPPESPAEVQLDIETLLKTAVSYPFKTGSNSVH